MRRGWVWVQILIGWLPVWALYTTLIVAMHGGSVFGGALIAARAVVSAALLGLAVYWLTERFPWPHPFRARFLLLHVIGAPLFAASWVGLTSALETLIRGRFIIIAPAGIIPYLILGVWLYVMVTGVAYATRAADRAARAETAAARAQLAALRGQLNPHFLFNALHTVVHLIPREPKRAQEAAEQVAALLRTVTEEDRDVVSVHRELEFVERYLALERLRFADRLRVRIDVAKPVRDLMVPSFAVQTLVENAIRHGVAPKVEPTDVEITGRLSDGRLVLTVRDNGAGGTDGRADGQTGTGLSRLRERLAVLYGDRARLDIDVPAGGGFAASLVIPATIDE